MGSDDLPTITKRLLDAVVPDGTLRIIRDDQLQGFGVQVTAQGRMSFCITYRLRGRSKRTVIGRYGPLTVETARRKAIAMLAKAGEGEEPVPKYGGATVAALFQAWMTGHVASHCRPQTASSYRSSFNATCKRRFGNLPPAHLTYAVVAKAHAELAATPVAANHMIRTMRAMLAWAETQKLVRWPEGNPASRHRLYEERPVERILSVPEVRTFIAKIPKAPMSAAVRRLLMLELLLGQRSGELASMRRADIDLVAAVWKIPAERNKANRTHVVPLPPWSRALIAEAIDEAVGALLFPSPTAVDDRGAVLPVDSHACASAMIRAQRTLDEDGKPAKQTPESSWVMDFRDAEGKPNPISPHDLRRTCSSYLELLGHNDAVRGAILNHSRRRNVTAKHYSAADLLKLKRTALLQWEACVREIVAGGDPFASGVEDDRAEEARVLGGQRDVIPSVARPSSGARAGR